MCGRAEREARGRARAARDDSLPTDVLIATFGHGLRYSEKTLTLPDLSQTGMYRAGAGQGKGSPLRGTPVALSEERPYRTGTPRQVLLGQDQGIAQHIPLVASPSSERGIDNEKVDEEPLANVDNIY